MFWQFFHESLVHLAIASVILVMLPVVLEVGFYLLSELLVDGHILVKMSQQAEPFR